MILNESERGAIEDDCEMMIGKPAFDAIEAAVLAKLCAGVEMPEPFPAGYIAQTEYFYTADQLQAYGAAARAKALEALQAEVARLTAELGDLPEAQADMLHTIKELRAMLAWIADYIRAAPPDLAEVKEWLLIADKFAAAGASPQPAPDHSEHDLEMVSAQPSQATDPSAPWLSDAHMLCTDQGIAPGNITERIRALRDKLEQSSQAGELSDSIMTLADEYATAVVEFSKRIGDGADSMSPLAVEAGDKRAELAAAIAAINAKGSK